jgi:acetyl esterase/lipase
MKKLFRHFYFKHFFAFVIWLTIQCAFCQETIYLWDSAAPGAMGDNLRDNPYIKVFLPLAETANGSAILICPGGAYGDVMMTHEGEDVARWYNEKGITGIVLYYRTAPYRFPIPLTDAKRAMRIIHSKANEWALDTSRTGILGFSAGGHLASMVAAYGDDGLNDTDDITEQFSSKPDFTILVYPVITTVPEYTHPGSFENLLGQAPSQSLPDSLSAEKQVTENTVPCFLVHGINDEAVPVENSRMYHDSCVSHNVPVKLYEIDLDCGYHGFGLGCGNWADTSMAWMKDMGLVGIAGPGNSYYQTHSQSAQAKDVSGSSIFVDLKGRKIKKSRAVHRTGVYLVHDPLSKILVKQMMLR